MQGLTVGCALILIFAAAVVVLIFFGTGGFGMFSG